MYRKRFQGFKSLEPYRETSNTNNDLDPDNQWKQSVSTKFIAFLVYTEFSGCSTISIYTDYQNVTYGYVNKIDSKLIF